MVREEKTEKKRKGEKKMARVKLGEESNYFKEKSENDALKFDWLSLKKDGETIRVRFMYDLGESFESFSVHNLLEKEGSFTKKKFIDCLAEDKYGTGCPLCKAGYTRIQKYYIPCYDVDNKRVLLWERGRMITGDLTMIAEAHERDNEAIVGTIFTIRRKGEAKSSDTTYTIYKEKHDDTTLADLVDADGNHVQRPEYFGVLILSRPKEDMEAFLATGELPKREKAKNQSSSDADAVKRRPSSDLIDSEEVLEDEIPF